MKCHVFLWFTV